MKNKSFLKQIKFPWPNQSESLIAFTKLNHARTKRWEKRYQPVINFSEYNPAESEIWLVITETWCGDAAQLIPVINTVSDQMANVEVRFVLRDEYPELMDLFLTNGSRSIPKLIRLRRKDLSVLSTWGARPANAQKLVDEYKTQPDFKEILAKWYIKDNGESVEKEFAQMLR